MVIQSRRYHAGETTKLYQSLIALIKGLELLLDVTFFIAPAKHEVLNRLKEHIDTKYQTPKELELNGPEKSIESQQQKNDPHHDTEDPQKDPPEVIFVDQDVSDGEDSDSPEVIEIPE